MVNANPLFSIILPTYNGEKYLEESLRSLFEQSFKDFEVIAIDNGSTDSTLDILSHYSENITILQESRKGVTYARNHGIKSSRGLYISFIDQDDIWFQNKLSIQKSLLESDNQVGMVGCGHEVINGDGKLLRIVRKKNKYVDKDSFLQHLLIRNIVGPPASISIRKECLEKIGLYDTMLDGVEDKDLWIRIVDKYDVKFHEEPLIKYRVHDNNAHKNVCLMKSSQKKLLMKHFAKIYIRNITKAFGYIYLDAARENFYASKYMSSFSELLKSILIHPLKIYSEDDRWKLLVKLMLPKSVINIVKKHDCI